MRSSSSKWRSPFFSQYAPCQHAVKERKMELRENKIWDFLTIGYIKKKKLNLLTSKEEKYNFENTSNKKK